MFSFLCRHHFVFLFFHIICTIVFWPILRIINVGCLEFHCYVAFLQNTSSGIPLTESMITLFCSARKYLPKYIFNQGESTINFKSQPHWLYWIVEVILVLHTYPPMSSIIQGFWRIFQQKAILLIHFKYAYTLNTNSTSLLML